GTTQMKDVMTETTASGERQGTVTAKVLLYSDDKTRREEVRTLVGRRASFDTPIMDWTDEATPEAVVAYAEEQSYDLRVLDGEAGKHGGMGLARTLKSEIFELPPVLLIIAREQDKWLASWSEAEGVVSLPLDPISLQEAVADLLRTDLAG